MKTYHRCPYCGERLISKVYKNWLEKRSGGALSVFDAWFKPKNCNLDDVLFCTSCKTERKVN
jgi:predicted RNA-binding Zn-ribbon protein involved in translation (DUF1610 family)